LSRGQRCDISLAIKHLLILKGSPGSNPTLTLQESPAQFREPVEAREVLLKEQVNAME
jgi:hypothetical protein